MQSGFHLDFQHKFGSEFIKKTVLSGQFRLFWLVCLKIILPTAFRLCSFIPLLRASKHLLKCWRVFSPKNRKNRVLIIKGYAGTGKTTLISALVNVLETLGKKSVLLAPTGRAAKVLSAYSGKNASTIHKSIYRQRSAADTFGVFVLGRNIYSDTLFLVDEASMISNQTGENNVFGTDRLLDDLIHYVRNEQHCRLIIVGDTAQLPVGVSMSPALDKTVLQRYFKETEEMGWTDVVRQSQESGILVNATLIRNNIIRNIREIPKFHVLGFKDIQHV